jgi:hypothetical protein
MYALRPPRFDQLMRHAAIGTRNAYLEHARKRLGPMEDLHAVGASNDAPFHPDWRGAYLWFRKDNEGFVHLVGIADWFRNRPSFRNRNWSYTFGRIFTLPPGYRPQYPAYIGTKCRWRAFDYSYYQYPGAGEERSEERVNVAADFVIEPDGRVRPIVVNATFASIGYYQVEFESLAFRAANPVL